MGDEVSHALETIFSADSELYRNRGFMRRVGFGERPALVNIDLANAWTRPGNAFSCDAKFGDVEPLETVLEFLERIAVLSAAEAAAGTGRG